MLKYTINTQLATDDDCSSDGLFVRVVDVVTVDDHGANHKHERSQQLDHPTRAFLIMRCAAQKRWQL